MRLGFEHPEWLWALVLAIPLGWVGLRWFSAMAPVRRWSAVAARVALLALIVGMLAGASAVRRTDRVAVVGVIDVSGSVRRFAGGAAGEDGQPFDPLVAARRFFAAAEKGRRADDLLGLVVFDGRAMAVASPSRVPVTDRPLDLHMVEGSDLEGALRYAAALVPPDASGRLVLVSDGVQTRGDAERGARELGAGGGGPLPVDVVPVLYEVTGETSVVSVDAPPRAVGEATVNVRVVLNSTGGSSGVLRLTREGEPVDINGEEPGDGRRLVLGPGAHVEVITVRLESSRVHRFRAVFEPDLIEGESGTMVASGDTLGENNSGEAVTSTPGRGAVLVLSGGGEHSPTGSLVATLRAAGIETTAAAPVGLPTDLLSLQAFDAVILQNVPAEAIPEEGQELLAAYVRELGGGLVMVGGPESFGAGGWKGSTLEPLIPVRLNLPEKLVEPDAAIVLVMDVSGSMGRPVRGSGANQQQIANEAAARAVESLSAKDLVGAIAFSDDFEVVVPLGPNDDPKTTAEKILSLAHGGGTNIGPALEEAGRQLDGVRAPVKHVIVVSDGRSMGASELPALARDLHARKITVSTISIGDQSDDRTMEAMALRGGGTFYPVSNPALLPRFFLKAVRVVRTPMVREAPFQPVVMPTPSPTTAGVTDPPPLHGVNLTQWRPEPTIVRAMQTPQGEPLLAVWQVELGQVAAFTSDADRWAEPWLDWEGYSRMWVQIARSVSRSATDGRLELATEVSGDRLRIRLEAAGEDGRPLDLLSVPVTVYGPSGEARELSLSQTGAGLYEASAEARESGTYVTVAKPRLGAMRLTPVVAGTSLAAGLEFRALRSDEGLLRRVAQASGGRVLDLADLEAAAGLFDREGVPPSTARTPLWGTLLLWTLGVLLLDVGTRRVAWDRLVSRRFGQGLKAAAADAVRDRGQAAARTVERLRGGAKAGEWPTSGPLGDDDAKRLAAREADRRAQQRLAALKAMREEEARPEGRDEPPKAGADGSSGLLAAKRRARVRFGEEESTTEAQRHREEDKK